MRGRTVLVTGGAGGTGLATTREIHGLGAEVIVGTRRPDRYAQVAAELGGERVHPFVVDITDEEEARRHLDALAERGVVPTDVIHCAAGGLEQIVRPLMRKLMALRRLPEADREAAIVALLDELPARVAETRDHGYRVNLEAPRALTEHLVPRLPAGGGVLFTSSLWSSFHGHGLTPAFYPVVAGSKQAFEEYLAERAPAWAASGVATAIVSGHVIIDTNLGELIDRYLIPTMPPERQAPARSYFITSQEMVQAVVGTLRRSRELAAAGRVARLYVLGPGRVVERLAPDDPALVLGTPLLRPGATAPDRPAS